MNTTLQPLRPTVERYTRDVVGLHSRLSFRHLPDEVRGEPLWLRRRSTTPLTTVAALESQIPDRYLLGIYGYRLSQYLRLGWACPDTVYAQSLFAEPRHRPDAQDVHVVTLDQRRQLLPGQWQVKRPVVVEPACAMRRAA